MLNWYVLFHLVVGILAFGYLLFAVIDENLTDFSGICLYFLSLIICLALGPLALLTIMAGKFLSDHNLDFGLRFTPGIHRYDKF